MKIWSVSLTRSCPMYSARRRGRRLRSTGTSSTSWRGVTARSGDGRGSELLRMAGFASWTMRKSIAEQLELLFVCGDVQDHDGDAGQHRVAATASIADELAFIESDCS